MRYIIILILACILIFSCSQKTKKSPKLIDEYNNQIEEGYENDVDWVKSPLLIVSELCFLGQISKETDIRFRKINQGEVAKEVEIFIEERGVLDDSNPNSLYYFRFILVEGRWKVVE